MTRLSTAMRRRGDYLVVDVDRGTVFRLSRVDDPDPGFDGTWEVAHLDADAATVDGQPLVDRRDDGTVAVHEPTGNLWDRAPWQTVSQGHPTVRLPDTIDPADVPDNLQPMFYNLARREQTDTAEPSTT